MQESVEEGAGGGGITEPVMVPVSLMASFVVYKPVALGGE
jgi:hypothetical protein